MTDQDSPGFTVVDKRVAAQENSADAPEPQNEVTSEAQTEINAPPADAPADAFEENTSEAKEGADDAGYQLPDPTLLLSMAALQMDARSLVSALLPLFDGMAWRALGLLADPKTGEPIKDLPMAQLAIDCVQFFLSKVEGGLPDAERRDAQRRLNDLRMNYLAKLRES